MNTTITKKIAIAGISIVAALTLVTAVAMAQSSTSPMSLSINGAGSVQLTGTVTAISGSTVSVSSWAGTWLINASQATVISPTSNIADVKVGDNIKVAGTISSGMSVTAKTIKDLSLQTNAMTGVISNFNSTAGTFTLTTKNNNIVNVTTDANTKVYSDNSIVPLSTLANNSKVMIAGSLNTSTNTMTASSIRILPVKNDNDQDSDNNGHLGINAIWNAMIHIGKH